MTVLVNKQNFPKLLLQDLLDSLDLPELKDACSDHSDCPVGVSLLPSL